MINLESSNALIEIEYQKSEVMQSYIQLDLKVTLEKYALSKTDKI